MQEYQIGDKVNYNNGEVGVVYGIRKNEAGQVLEYLIDTGNDTRVDEIVTEGDAPNIFIRQPEQAEVQPENITLISEG
jgi:hypothetical protein